MPCTVRWRSSLRLLEWYSEQWVKIKRVIDKHPQYFSSSAHSAIVRNVKNLTLFQQVTDAIKCLTPICNALNQIQDNSIQVAQAVEAWKDLLEKFRGNTEFQEWLEKCEARSNVSVPDVWFVANLLHPKLIGNRLTQFELKKAVSWIKENKPGDLTAFMNYFGGEKEQVKEAFTEATEAKVENFLKVQNLMGELRWWAPAIITRSVIIHSKYWWTGENVFFHGIHTLWSSESPGPGESEQTCLLSPSSER